MILYHHRFAWSYARHVLLAWYKVSTKLRIFVPNSKFWVSKRKSSFTCVNIILAYISFTVYIHGLSHYKCIQIILVYTSHGHLLIQNRLYLYQLYEKIVHVKHLLCLQNCSMCYCLLCIILIITVIYFLCDVVQQIVLFVQCFMLVVLLFPVTKLIWLWFWLQKPFFFVHLHFLFLSNFCFNYCTI